MIRCHNLEKVSSLIDSGCGCKAAHKRSLSDDVPETGAKILP
jgi:hypothetical protein